MGFYKLTLGLQMEIKSKKRLSSIFQEFLIVRSSWNLIIFKLTFLAPSLPMTSKISIDNINIKNHQANFMDPIDLEITFSNLVPLSHSIEWKIIYFGSANDEDSDQVLEQFQIPPVDQVQTMKFQLSCPPPDFNKVLRQQLLSVTAMILTVSYRNQQFIRVGYYIHYQYCGNQLPQNLSLAPAQEVVNFTKRTILFDKPRVTKFNIKWQDKVTHSPESQREGKKSRTDSKAIEEESSQKQLNQQKQSTLQEKEQRSNNFSDQGQQRSLSPIQCQ